jgi:hypothetical protein
VDDNCPDDAEDEHGYGLAPDEHDPDVCSTWDEGGHAKKRAYNNSTIKPMEIIKLEPNDE